MAGYRPPTTFWHIWLRWRCSVPDIMGIPHSFQSVIQCMTGVIIVSYAGHDPYEIHMEKSIMIMSDMVLLPTNKAMQTWGIIDVIFMRISLMPILTWQKRPRIRLALCHANVIWKQVQLAVFMKIFAWDKNPLCALCRFMPEAFSLLHPRRIHHYRRDTVNANRWKLV